MPFRLRITVAILASAVLLAFFAPLLLPLPALEDTVAAEELADADSRFIRLPDFTLHYHEAGSLETAERHFVLLHGFGLNLFSWRAVLPALGEQTYALAYDRPAFGLTSRPAVERGSRNPYSLEAEVALLLALLDAKGIEQAILVGNSAGGNVALEFALQHPERSRGLVLVAPAAEAPTGAPAWLRPLLSTPQFNRVGPVIMRQFAEDAGLQLIRAAWYDPEKLSAETLEAYRRNSQVDAWDEALWQLSKANRNGNFAQRLPDLRLPTLIITGAEDSIVPAEQSQNLSQAIAGAQFVSLEACGHVPQEECPDAWLEAVEDWLEQHF